MTRQKQTTDTATSPAQEMKATKASSPMPLEATAVVQQKEKSTSTSPATTCDVKLSPILFIENLATSPMSGQGDNNYKVKIVDASTSPPRKVSMTSAATLPPKPSDLQLSKTYSPTTLQGKDEEENDPISLKFDLDISTEKDLDKLLPSQEPDEANERRL